MFAPDELITTLGRSQSGSSHHNDAGRNRYNTAAHAWHTAEYQSDTGLVTPTPTLTLPQPSPPLLNLNCTSVSPCTSLCSCTFPFLLSVSLCGDIHLYSILSRILTLSVFPWSRHLHYSRSCRRTYFSLGAVVVTCIPVTRSFDRSAAEHRPFPTLRKLAIYFSIHLHTLYLLHPAELQPRIRLADRPGYPLLLGEAVATEISCNTSGALAAGSRRRGTR